MTDSNSDSMLNTNADSVPELFGLSSTLELNHVSASVKKGMKEIGSTNDMFMVDPRKVKVWKGFNTRIKDDVYWEGIKSLATSIMNNGFYKDKPLACIVVNESGELVVYCVEGGRRLDAALMRMEWMTPEEADSFRIPAVPKERETSEVDLVYGLAQGNNAVAFRPYEMAILVKRLKQVYGQTNEEILERLGSMVSPSYLNHLLIVAGAPRKIAELIISDKLSVTHAVKIMNEYGSDAIAVLEKAESNAQAEGKEKITDRYMPGRRLEKALRKEARALYESATQVINDPGFHSLSEHTRAVLQDLLNDLKAADDPLDMQNSTED